MKRSLLRHGPATSTKNFDIVVVGGGTAGCIVASQLARKSIKTLLVERGAPLTAFPAYVSSMPGCRITGDHASRNVVRSYTTTPQPVDLQDMEKREAMTLTGASVLGGSCVTGDLAWMRPFESEFSDWILDSDVYPWFNAVERRMNESDDITVKPTAEITRPRYQSQCYRPFVESCAGMAMPITQDFSNNLRLLPGGVCGRADVLVSASGDVVTTEQQYLARALKDSVVKRYLTVRTDAEALRLNVFNGRSVDSVKVRSNSGVEDIAAQQVVLCSGAIETPKLLLQSGVGATDVLRGAGIECTVEVPGVGRNLFDQVEVPLVYTCAKPITANALASSSLVQYLCKRDWKSQREGWYLSDFSDLIAMRPLKKDPGSSLPSISVVMQPFAATPKEGPYSPHEPHQFRLLARLSRPTSRGYVRVASADAATPRIEINALSTKEDQEAMKEAVEFAREITSQGPYAGYISGNVAGDLGRVRLAGQVGGTCRMGDSGDYVVGNNFKLRGVENAFVCDSSVIPKPLTGGSNATVWALASRFVERYV
eukprot:PhM_4_TR5408/c0_g1_i1/m.77279/K00108/betA, CHDH; choline dehydrogenase